MKYVLIAISGILMMSLVCSAKAQDWFLLTAMEDRDEQLNAILGEGGNLILLRHSHKDENGDLTD